MKTRQPFSWLFSKFLDMSVVFSQIYEGRKNRAFGSKCCKRKSHTGAAKWKVTCLLAFVCMHGNVVVNLVLHFNKIIIIWQLHKKVTKTRYYKVLCYSAKCSLLYGCYRAHFIFHKYFFHQSLWLLFIRYLIICGGTHCIQVWMWLTDTGVKVLSYIPLCF